MTARNTAMLVACALGCFTATASAQFTNASSQIPQGSPNNNSFSENVDFGDVDLDGDWDAAFADGGDQGNDRNRIWINRGGLQGGTVGFFDDATNARFPNITDQSRDIEFADIDDDGDLDVYSSNTSQITNQTNRWWVNQGGAQGGTLGFFTDQTASRWVGLGGAGSSVPSNAVLPGGGFIDWSCDCDFADLDNDGDLDLFHSSYGGAFGGNVPSRIFLNNGNGFFAEFNPSGFQLSGNTIQNGQPALWAEGTHQHNTSNTTGAQSDVANTPLDIDLGDIDGDFDIDILFGGRQEDPRLFVNRLEETGTMSFRDRSNAQFPSNWASGGNNYEQEMGDLDGDGDLDIMGLNWNGFDDVTMRNNGAGTFTNKSDLSNSGADDNEMDAFDYDNDGDLDIYVANFSGSDKLYTNNDTGSGNFNFTYSGTVPGTNSASLDADCCDVDKDGDYDVMTADDSGSDNELLINTTQTPDTSPPYVPRIENPGNQVAQAGSIPVRAQVYDNAPYYVTWYNPTRMVISVDGLTLPGNFPMKSSGGQIFRGELPRHLVGSVSYRVVSEDEYGNVGASVPEAYTATGNTGTIYGSDNPGTNGPLYIKALCQPTAGETLYLAGGNILSPFVAGFWISAASQPPAPWSGFISNLDLTQLVYALRLFPPDFQGDDVVGSVNLPSALAGTTLFAQFLAIDTVDGRVNSKGLQMQL